MDHLSQNIGELPVGQVLAAAGITGTPEVSPTQRIDQKVKARGMKPTVVKNRIKPAAVVPPPVKRKQEKPTSQLATEIKAACLALNIEIKEFGTAGSFVLRLPAWAEFKKQLPQDGSAKAEAKMFHRLRDAVNDLTGDDKSTWVIHLRGSVACHFRFNK